MCFYIEYCSKSIHMPVYQVSCLHIKMHKMATNRPTISSKQATENSWKEQRLFQSVTPHPTYIANYKVNEISGLFIYPMYVVACLLAFPSDKTSFR